MSAIHVGFIIHEFSAQNYKISLPAYRDLRKLMVF
jgi:hypothetical protein